MKEALRRNPAGMLLLVTGVLAALTGSIVWIAGANQLSHDTVANTYSQALVGFDTGNVGGDWWTIGTGIGLVALGVLLLVGAAITWAIVASGRAADAQPAQ
ncbi:hypothetical protein ACRAWB_01935 [Leifsonia poae]|uniref:hypothetical protein n=1 Tax=Leifsonia poae TaxID=110933 RepID=UPI003D6854C5